MKHETAQATWKKGPFGLLLFFLWRVTKYMVVAAIAITVFLGVCLPVAHFVLTVLYYLIIIWCDVVLNFAIYLKARSETCQPVLTLLDSLYK